MAVPLRLNPQRASGNPQRTPGCSEACDEVKAVFGDTVISTGIYRHDPYAHQDYGKWLATTRMQITTGVVISGGISVDHDRGCVRVDGRCARLTPTELAIMLYASARLDLLCAARDIIRSVFGDEYVRDVSPDSRLRPCPEWRLLGVHMSRLRSKLGPYRDLLVTRNGVGYTLHRVAPAEVRP